ncbi:HlyD family efflux transporter periplasmic adaptor subunit [Enhygromyxa salina]|uniref:HlyD family secretion protein n=1 Tax=Enhygromyxa salina TaxID=215803 RepID=A0A2S9YPD8_9BACT|nr:HlyD family efflux transporter periplasmic adaptor subunit [Enhygromyxa salina]PRQ06950.1 HlyD family secretion protein [Enhygromyxa salina]
MNAPSDCKDPDDEPRSAASQSLFRAAALEAHEDDYLHGAPLLVVPGWARLAAGLLITAVAVALGYASVVPISSYAHGVAIVRDPTPALVRSPTRAVVRAVVIRPGQAVAAGDPLVQLDGPAAGTVRSTAAGVVAEVAVTAGDMLEPGDALVTLTELDPRPIVELHFDVHQRPRMDLATPMFIELDGFAASRTPVVVEGIAELVGPSDAAATPPSVRVRARLPELEFSAADGRYPVYAGMRGRAEAELGSAPLLESVLPRLFGA